MKTLEQQLAEWDAEVEHENNMGNPRFVFKHALRLQGLFLNDDNEITNASGKLYAYLGVTEWQDKDTIKAMIKRVDESEFVILSLDIEKLRKP